MQTIHLLELARSWFLNCWLETAFFIQVSYIDADMTASAMMMMCTSVHQETAGSCLGASHGSGCKSAMRPITTSVLLFDTRHSTPSYSAVPGRHCCSRDAFEIYTAAVNKSAKKKTSIPRSSYQVPGTPVRSCNLIIPQ